MEPYRTISRALAASALLLAATACMQSPKSASGFRLPGGKSLTERARLNERMTVRQLIDLVAFLQSNCHVVAPQVDPYAYVYP